MTPDSSDHSTAGASEPPVRGLVPSTTPQPEFDSYRSLIRLLVGGAVEGSDLLFQRLRAWEERYPQHTAPAAWSQPSDEELARYAAIGLLIETAELLRRGAQRTARISLAAANLSILPLRLAAGSRLAGPFRGRLQRWADLPQQTVTRWTETGRAEETRGRYLAQMAFANTIGEIVDYLSGSPAIRDLIDAQVAVLLPSLATNEQLDALVQAVAGRYLDYILDHPAQLDTLVQAVAGNYLQYLQQNPAQVEELILDQGNKYIDYLTENPEQVQEIIQGQSLGLTAEIVEEVRERTVTADQVLEAIARSLLRRSPRNQLPEPPPEVKSRAVRTAYSPSEAPE